MSGTSERKLQFHRFHSIVRDGLLATVNLKFNSMMCPEAENRQVYRHFTCNNSTCFSFYKNRLL